MTITVSVEELKAYETAMREWWARAIECIDEFSTEEHTSFGPIGRTPPKIKLIKDAFTAYLQKNPMPTLIPKV